MKKILLIFCALFLLVSCNAVNFTPDQEAALGIAIEKGFDPGIRSYLKISDDPGRNLWILNSTTFENRANCERSGLEFLLDKETNEILSDMNWHSIC